MGKTVKLFLMSLIGAIALGAVWVKQAEAIPSEAIRTQNVGDICTTKTGTIRNVPDATKRKVYARDGIVGGNYKDSTGRWIYEVDHVISLELGGSNQASNLKIQRGDVACNYHDKDKLENKLHDLVCVSKEITPQAAQELIYDDWERGYKLYVNSEGCGK